MKPPINRLTRLVIMEELSVTREVLLLLMPIPPKGTDPVPNVPAPEYVIGALPAKSKRKFVPVPVIDPLFVTLVPSMKSDALLIFKNILELIVILGATPPTLT